jgi:limonene-1,2-epoxide hydrolase
MAQYEWDWPHTKKWPRFSGEKIDIVKKMFLAGEALNVDNFIKFFTDECYYQFGNFPPAHSPQEIAAASSGFIEKCEGLHHHIANIWEADDGTLFCEMEVTYINHDGQVFTLPCCDIIRFEGEKVKELKIFMDINPLFSG